MRRRLGMLTLASLALLVGAGSGGTTSAGPSVFNRIATGQLRPAVVHVNGVTKVLPFFSGGIVASAQESRLPASTFRAVDGAAPSGVPGVSTSSVGCRDRSGGRNFRVNQDCTYRRQAEEDL